MSDFELFFMNLALQDYLLIPVIFMLLLFPMWFLFVETNPVRLISVAFSVFTVYCLFCIPTDLSYVHSGTNRYLHKIIETKTVSINLDRGLPRSYSEIVDEYDCHLTAVKGEEDMMAHDAHAYGTEYRVLSVSYKDGRIDSLFLKGNEPIYENIVFKWDAKCIAKLAYFTEMLNRANKNLIAQRQWQEDKKASADQIDFENSKKL